MKRKPVLPRNPFVAAAKFKKAGAHGKSEKALRRAATVELRGRSFEVKHPAFTRKIRDRWPCAPTNFLFAVRERAWCMRPAVNRK